MRLIYVLMLVLAAHGCTKKKESNTDKDSGAAPTVTLAAASTLTNVSPISISATFSSEVVDFAASGVTVGNGTVSGISGEGAAYVVSITPLNEGVVTVSLTQGAAKSLAGAHSVASNEITVTYDVTAPKLSFTSMDRAALDLSPTADPTLNLVLNENATVILYNDSSCSVSLAKPAELQGTNDQKIKIDGIGTASKTHIHGKAVDAAGNASACASLVVYSHLLKFVDPNPGVSNGFGTHIVELKNGNVVITSPQATVNGVANAGAVYLFNGETGALISTLFGSTANDKVGLGGVTALTNGNYVVSSSLWDKGATVDAGAVTFRNGTAGISVAVSSSNSLVGSGANDRVGSGGVTALTNGNYVVNSYDSDCCGFWNGGAVTFGNGTTGVSGTVTSGNSLVGSRDSDQVGSGGVTALTNGNYVVSSYTWYDGATPYVGAVTFGSGTTGISGAITASNSLVGSSDYDRVGAGGVTALTNGNYVVSSYFWKNGADTDAGAVTFVNGTTGLPVGAVTAINSLVGSTADNRVGSGGVTALMNGNYVVSSPLWDIGATSNVGAVTFVNGTTGIIGAVTAINSLVGSTAGNNVGSGGVMALTNGNYVVSSPLWDNGATPDVGAVTFGNGTTGISGAVTAINSLVGLLGGDKVGFDGVTALTNGNYVVRSSLWNDGIPKTDVGAVTFGNGTTGISGAVTSGNSLVGSTDFDKVGLGGVTALTNGNYVVSSHFWDNGAASDAGVVTFGNGTNGISGAVTSSNSLVGSRVNDYVGDNGVTALTNGNYVVRSSFWDNGVTTNVGAVTFVNGTTGISGAVASSNSLAGSTSGAQIGSGASTATGDGKFIFSSPAYGVNKGLVVKVPGDSAVSGSL